MDTTPKTEAAGRLAEALDDYDAKFKALVAERMSATRYDEVVSCLEIIRQAKSGLFDQVFSEAVYLTIAHSDLMTVLWKVKMADVRGESGGDIAQLVKEKTQAHDEAIAALKAVCARVR